MHSEKTRLIVGSDSSCMIVERQVLEIYSRAPAIPGCRNLVSLLAKEGIVILEGMGMMPSVHFCKYMKRSSEVGYESRIDR